jgi:hypothetical protein
MFAQLTAFTVNFSMGRPKQPMEPKDFMPSEWAKIQVEETPKRRSRKLIATEVRGVMDILMGIKANA